MGIYLDPGNESFRRAVASDIYIDKTGMLNILNNSIGKENCCYAVSRARRFGKSMAAGMIDAYYSKGCDSEELFRTFTIADSSSFHDHLNKYHVLHIDMSTFFNAAKEDENPVDLMNDSILKEFKDSYPEIMDDSIKALPKAVETVWKNDVLTALIHMGYLAYDPTSEEAFIPNEEVREVFSSAIKVGDWTEIADALPLL